MQEFFYAFYILSGLFDSLFAVIDINLHIDFGITSSIILIFIMLSDLFFYSKLKFPKLFVQEVLILFLILLIAIISLLYTASPAYGKYKIIVYLKEFIFAFVFPFIVHKFDIKRFVKSFVFILFPYTIVYLYLVQVIPYRNEEVYISFISRYLTVGLFNGIIFFLMIFSKEKFYRNEFTQFFVAFVALVFTILSSARAPLIFLIFILFAYLLVKGFNLMIKKTWILYSFNVLIPGLFIFVFIIFSNKEFIVENLLSRTILRFSKFLVFFKSKGFDPSTYERILFWEFTIKKIFESLKTVLFGCGIGSFGIIYYGEDIRAYPHNI